MKSKKRIATIMLVTLLVLGAAVLYVYKEYNRSHKDTSELKPDYSTNAIDLLEEFETGESVANKKYWDKVILVDGMVKGLSKDDRCVYSVTLGDTTSMTSVRCSMDSIHNDEAAGIMNGGKIAMKGICAGYNADGLLGSDVILVRCVVSTNK